MANPFKSDRINVGAVDLVSGSTDPTAGAGVVAPVGSIYGHSGTGTIYSKTGAGDTQWTAVGSGGGAANDVEVVASTNASAALGNGVVYVPLGAAATESIEFQVRAQQAGSVAINVLYAMSAANAGNVRLQVDKRAFTVGGDPTAALTAGTAFTITPGNDANIHLLSEVTSTQMQVNCAAGDLVRVKIQRLGADGADTHTGDMRILKISALPAAALS